MGVLVPVGEKVGCPNRRPDEGIVRVGLWPHPQGEPRERIAGIAGGVDVRVRLIAVRRRAAVVANVAVPVGVTIGLLVTNTPLSAVAYLGIIMLGGIAVNNGIVLIEFVNELRKQGINPRDAVIEASKARLPPILMTSLTTILGLLPLAIGLGDSR